MTHPVETVFRSVELGRRGLSPTEVSRIVGVPRSTVREWLAGQVPRGRDGAGRTCSACGAAHNLAGLPPAYVYLLGMYLGDGCLSPHPRGVYKLRIALDRRYPGISEECESAMRAVMPRNSVARVWQPGWHELFSYSKSWPCLFPQHGPGRKHERPIVLAGWQEELVAARPDLLVRGLIHSDGCRFINTGRGWRWPRYSFSNVSADIRGIFCAACEQLGLAWTPAGNTVYVSRKADVAVLDRLVGPKR